MRIATFVTENTPYENVAEEYLVASCRKLNLPCEVINIPNKGTWQKNVAEKPAVIVSILSTMRQNELLLFVDADARILRYPTLIDELASEKEFCYYELNWNQYYGYTQLPAHKEILSGTLIIRNTDSMIRFCDEWSKTAKKSTKWEQKILEEKIRTNLEAGGSWLFQLPHEYCYIETKPNGTANPIVCDPVITHHQASRKLKKIINGQT